MAQQATREVRDQAREVHDHAREHAQTLIQKVKTHSPHTPLGWVALLAVGGILAFGSAIALIVLTPVFLFFSPILVPLAVILFLCTAGLVMAGGSALVAGSAITWVYKYFKGRHPPGSDQIEHAMSRLHDTAEHMKHKARDLGGHMLEAAPGA